MRLKYTNNISWQVLNNEVYVVDEITSKTYKLDKIGKDFWLLIKDNYSFKEIVEILNEKYIVSKDILLNDMNEFTESLILQNLLIKGDY